MEGLNPVTGLENEPLSKPTIKLKDFSKSTSGFSGGTETSAMRELLKPVDLSTLISDNADSKYVQALKPSDFVPGTDKDLFAEYENNLNSAKNSYLKQLDDEQNWLEFGTAAVGKFAAKTVTGTAAGLLGFAWGLVKSVGTGSVDPMIQNEVYDAYDYINEGINKAMPLYTSNTNYHNQGFFDKLFSADAGKLLGDEVGDALAFTASAILQEVVYTAITAGTFGAAAPLQAAGSAGIALRGAKLLNKGMKALKAENKVGKISSLVNNLEEASKIASTANTLNKYAGTARGLVMSSSFEAGIEARGTKEAYIQEATSKFKEVNGYEPTEQDIAQIEKESESAMWSNYLGNLAILSASNLAQFSSIFLKGAKVAKETSDVTRHITKAADGSLDVAKKSKLGKAATYAYLTVKNPITEGLEESAQGISNEAALDYWSKAYDPEYNKESLSYLQSTIDGGMKYVNTNEAGNSFGIGFLVGMLGMPMPKKMGGYSGGVYGEIKGYNQSLERAKQIVADLNANPSLAGSMAKNYQNMVKANGFSADMDNYAKTGDVFNFKNAEHDYLFSYIKNRIDLGMGEFLNEDFDALEKMSLEDFNNEFKIEGASEFTSKEKAEKIRKAKAFAEDVTKYTETVQNILDYKGTSKEVGARVSDTIVHAASTLKNMDVRESELTKQLEEMIGVTNIDIDNITNSTRKNSVVRKLAKYAKKELANEELTKQEKKELKNALGSNPRAREIYNAIKSTKDSKTISELTEELGGLVTVDNRGAFTNKADQTDFINQAKALIENASKLKAEGLINKDNAEKLVEDIAKIKERREVFSQYYEFLTTEKGINALNEATLKAEQLRAKDIQDDIDNKAENAAEKATTEADDAYVSTVSADASDEVKEKIAKVKDDKAKQGLKKVGDIDKSNIRDHVQARWNMSNPELKELYLKEKPLFLEQFAGKFGLPELPSMRNAPPNAIKSYIAQALDGAEGNELADALIAFFEGNKAALEETIESDVKKALDENEEVQTTEPTEPKYANYQPVKAPADANRTQGSEFAMEFNGEFWEYSRDENNQLIDNEDFNFIISKADSEYANTQVKESDVVTIELSLEHTFGTDYGKLNKTNPDKLALVVVHTDKDGVKHPISTVAAYQPHLINQTNRAQYEALKAMRADIFNQLIKDGYIDNQFNVTAKGKALGNTLIPTNYSSTIELVLPGRRIHSLNQEDYKPVTKALGKDVVLGVAISTEGRTEIQFPNSNKETLVLPNVQPGAVYALVEEKGASFPVRLKTRKVTAEEINIVKDLLDEAKKLDLSTPEGKANLAEIKSQINDIVYVSENELAKGLSNNNQLEILKNHISSRRAQVSRFKINTKGYNEALGDKVVTSISDRPTSRNFVLNGYNVNNKSNVAEEVTVSRTSKKEKTPETTAATFVPVEPYTDAEGNVIPKGPEITTSTESQTQTATQDTEAKKAEIKILKEAWKEELNNKFDERQLGFFKDGWSYAVAARQDYFGFDGEYAQEKYNEFKEINAKYDAELKALESAEAKPKVKETVETTKKDFTEKINTLESIKERFKNLGIGSFVGNLTRLSEIATRFKGPETKGVTNYQNRTDNPKVKVLKVSSKDNADEFVRTGSDIRLDSENPNNFLFVLNFASTGTSSGRMESNAFILELGDLSSLSKNELEILLSVLNSTFNKGVENLKDVENSKRSGFPVYMDSGINDNILTIEKSLKDNLVKAIDLIQKEYFSTTSETKSETTTKSKIPVSALGESIGSNVVEESTPTVVKRARINLNEDSDPTSKPTETPKRGSFSEDEKFKLKEGKTGKVNTKKALEWLKNALPNIPVTVLEDYVKILNENGAEAWGVFRNGGIEFLENAPQGVPYHEAFHAIFNSYLSESDQISMMVEAQAKTGLTDDLALEEWLADKFADFMITKFEDKSLGKKILEFFKGLLKSLNLVSDSKLNEYFTELSQTVFKGDKKVITESRFKNKDPFTATQRYNRIAMLTDMFMGVLNAQKQSVENKNKSINSIINNYTFTTKIITTPIYGDAGNIELSEPITFKGVSAIFADAYAGQLSSMYNNALDVAEKDDVETFRKERAILAAEQLALVMDNFFVKRGDTYELSDLLIDATAALKENYINVKINSVKSEPISVEETNEELRENAETEDVESLDKWMVSSAKLNTKDTASWILKFEVSNIDINDGFDDIGYPIKYSAENLMASMKHDMVDLLDVGEMIEYMNAHKNIKPYYKKVLALMESDAQFEAAFFNTFSTVKVGERLMIKSVETENGEITTKWMTIDNSGVNNTDLLLEEWDSAFKARLRATSELGKEDGRRKTPLEKMTKAKADLDTYLNSVFKAMSSLEPMVTNKGLRITEARKIAGYLNEFGIGVTEDAIKKIFDNSYLPAIESGTTVSATIKLNPLLVNLNGSMGAMLEQMLAYAKTYNPEETKRSPLVSEKKLTETFVKSVANTVDTIYESSALNADGEKVMVNRVPNFLHRQLLKLRKNKNGIIEKYKRDRFYAKNLWLSELKSGTQGLFKYMEVGGVKEGDEGNTYFNLSPRDKIITSLLNYFGNTNEAKEANNAWYETPILADMNKLPLISMKKYDINEVVKHLEDVYNTETDRIERVKSDQARYNKGENVDLIEFYHYVGTKDEAGFAKARGLKRHYLPITKGESLSESIKEYLDAEVSKYINKIKLLGVEVAAGSNKYTNGDFVRRFVYNKFLADINMNQLFNGDSAYYKSDTDMSKRTSQLGKPAQLLSVSNIPATYNTMYFENLIVDVSGAYTDIIEATEGAKKDTLLNALSGVDRADAQGVISIERWKDIISGQGLFKDEYLEAYNNIQDNKATAKDLSLIMQPIKPFYYGLESVGNKVVPTQNKNSEYVLLPSMRGSNPSVDKMLDLFDSGIHSVQFHSAVKVGAMRVQNLDSLTDISPQSIAGKFVTLNNSTYGIQLNVPEHHMDAEILFGTQIRKLIISNLKDTNKYGKYTINGVEYSKDELLRLYMDTINANLIEDSAELDKFFEDNSKLVDLLSAEVRDRGLAKKYLKTLALDSEGEFMFPLFFPITSKKAESLMSSLFANRITKQKIKGGSFVQVSDVLSSKNLEVIRDKKTGAIIEMQAMMPWTSKKFMPLNDAGEVDFDYISENHPELLEAVGFRIPTEDKYSMPVIKIVGFLPQQAGGTIMLPADFIALSGSDFDVDKLFVMLKEFKSIAQEIKNEFPDVKNYQIDQIRNKELYLEGVSELFKELNIEFKDKKITVVQSGQDTKESRNNLLIDITRGILQDPYHAKEIINPGSFVRYKNLRDKIAKLAKREQSDNFNINLPTNQLELFMRNTAGKELIGIFANHNVNHSLVQHLEISVRALDGANNVKVFKFIDGDTSYNLDGSIATETDGEYTSRFLAELLAAAVDNAKDPVLSSLNINTYTADFVSYLLRTGLSPELAMLFINQPVIKSISDKYFNSNEDRRELVSIIRDAKEDYPVKPEYSNIPLSKEDLEANIESMNKDTQSRVLSYFLDMLPASEELGTITQSMRADAKPSKTMTANSQFLKKYDRLDESIRSESSPVNMVHYFTELGIRKANETLSKYFPWQNDKFTAIKNQLTNIKEYDLTEQEEDFVNAQVISYLTKDYELFNINEKERLSLFNNLPAKFSELKSGELANNMFMQVTSLVDAGTKKSGKYKIIGVDNAQSISETQKEAVERAFLELYESHPEFAKELIKYTYVTSGTSFTRHSYLQLLPVEIFNTIKDENGRTYQEHLKNAVESNFNTEDFVDVFIKNFSHKYSFVKEFRSKDVVESKMDNNNNYIYFLVSKDESNIFAAPKFKKDKLGRIYKLYLETDTQSLYLPVPKLGIENVLYEPNNTSSISIKNDIVLTFKEKADVYESEGVKYATQLKDGKYKISKLNTQYRVTEDMGTFNNVADLLINPTLSDSNKDIFINKVIFEENLLEYYNKYVAKTASFEIVNNEDIADIVNEETTITAQPTVKQGIKEGVSELFESNPELANAVYETLGISNKQETVSEIYLKLGNKTKKDNIVIQPVYQIAGIQYAKSIGGIFSLRVNNTNNHFGNPFSSVESEIQKGLIRTKSTKESVEKYIEWILSPITTIKPEQHKFIREVLQSGKLKEKSIVYYKELGEPSHATALDYLINKYNWNNQITPQQKQQALQLYSQYLEQTGKQDIEGFKEFVDNNQTDTKDNWSEEDNAVKLTPQQQEAMDKVIEFINSGDSNSWFTIEGKAGTGKTTSIREAIAKFPNKTIAVAALAHKAKNVIAESLVELKNKKEFKGLQFYSLAGLLGMSMDLETGTFNTIPNDYSEPPIENADIIIIDEASMINEEGITNIMKMKSDNAKVIFLGDIGQLPPIREEGSKFEELPSPAFNTINKAMLTERIRQGEESPILPYADYYWNNSQSDNSVLNPISSDNRKSIISEKGNLIFTEGRKAIDLAVEEFKTSVAINNPNIVKVVVYRNDTRKQINNYVHKKLFGESEFNNGEIVMFFDKFKATDEITFENSDEIQIVNSKETTFNHGNNNFKGYYLETIVYDVSGKEKIIKIKAISKESKDAFNSYISSLFNQAKALPKTDKYRNQLFKQAYDIKNTYANIDYAYAVTSHKSQGSTYNSVIILEDDIMSVKPTSNKTKSNALYTAITRAKNNVLIVSEKNTENLKDFSLISSDPYILKSEDFKNFYAKELTKSQEITQEEALEYYKKCKLGI